MAIAQQNQLKQMKQLEEAQRLKEESAKNAQLIKMQKDNELMKNTNVQNLIRQQKYEAEKRRDMVSYKFYPTLIQFYETIGKTRKAPPTKKQTHKRYLGGE